MPARGRSHEGHQDDEASHQAEHQREDAALEWAEPPCVRRHLRHLAPRCVAIPGMAGSPGGRTRPRALPSTNGLSSVAGPFRSRFSPLFLYADWPTVSPIFGSSQSGFTADLKTLLSGVETVSAN